MNTPKEILQHANWHCRFGSNADATERTPDAGDIAAAVILAKLLATFEGRTKEAKRRIRCDQCEATMINGVFCHETGCPNTHSRYDADSDCWIKQRTCFVCGYECDADAECCND